MTGKDFLFPQFFVSGNKAQKNQGESSPKYIKELNLGKKTGFAAAGGNALEESFASGEVSA